MQKKVNPKRGPSIRLKIGDQEAYRLPIIATRRARQKSDEIMSIWNWSTIRADFQISRDLLEKPILCKINLCSISPGPGVDLSEEVGWYS